MGDIGWVFPSHELKLESEEDEKALNILLNQQNLMGESTTRNSTQSSMISMDFDLSLTGFEDHEINLYLDNDNKTATVKILNY